MLGFLALTLDFCLDLSIGVGTDVKRNEKDGSEMTTVETAKAIRQELKAAFPNYKFSVRKEDVGVINIAYNGDKEIRESVDAIARKFKGWNEFNTEYVWVNAYGAKVGA